MANPNVFQQLIQPVRSVTDYSNDLANADALRNLNALQALTLQQQSAATQQGLQERNALQRIAATSGGDRNALISGLRNSGMPGLMAQADSLEQSGAKLAESQSAAGKNNAEAGKITFETQKAKANKAITDITSLSSPQDALASLQAHRAAGDIDETKYQGVLATLQPALQDPAQFGKWQRQMVLGIMDAKDRYAATALKVDMVNAGGTIVPTNTNADAAPVGQIAGVSPIAVTQSPDNAATNATLRANNAATQAGEDRRAGFAPGGSGLSPDMETTARAIASGQLPAPTGMALLNPRNQRVLARVMEINPDYDATSVDAKRKAARDFGTGSQGNAMRSFAVAGQHLDQLGQLVDALGNGNTQIINKIGNAFAEQTGSTAPTNFDAAKDVVSKEVVKAIVAGGGGVAERAELAELMSKAKSPAQLKGVITQYRNLMAAQHDALLQQRRAAGLPDSTLPKYDGTEAGGKPTAAQTATPPGVVNFADLK